LSALALKVEEKAFGTVLKVPRCRTTLVKGDDTSYLAEAQVTEQI
jgi:hypothetical protein